MFLVFFSLLVNDETVMVLYNNMEEEEEEEIRGLYYTRTDGRTGFSVVERLG